MKYLKKVLNVSISLNGNELKIDKVLNNEIHLNVLPEWVKSADYNQFEIKSVF